MSELRDLYQEVILDHGKNPRNFGKIDDASCRADGYNPLCGDRLTLYLKTDEGRITDVRFEGAGCAISTASASMMTEALRDKTIVEVESLFKTFHELVTGVSGAEEHEEELGKLLVFGGVRDFPVRVKCATLAWHTLLAALALKEKTVSTE